MFKQTFKIRGMHCASCAGIIEKTFKKTEGVESAEVNYATETAKISFDGSKVSPHHLSQKIEPLGYSLVVSEAKAMGPVRGREGSERPSASNGMGMSESEHHKGTSISLERSTAKE